MLCIPPIKTIATNYYATTCRNNMTNEPHYYVFPTCSAEQLSHPSPPTLKTIGGKDLSLFETSATFSVPPGFVLTVALFQPWLDQIHKTNEWKAFVAAAADSNGVTKDHCDAIKAKCHEILSLDESHID